jgi:hypothetical protein
MMKRIAGLLAVILGGTMFVAAQNQSKSTESKGTEMVGYLCDSKCVKQDAGKSVCDTSCSEKGNDCVFVDDEGKVTKIANPNMAKGKMGKKVKVHGDMKDKDMMEIYDVVLANAG